MELREPIEDINQKLLLEFGTEFGNAPRFRVVFSEDMYEKRLTNFTDEGFELLQPEVRLLPKYKQYIQAKYILERLVPVPEGVETDLVTKINYEPIWVFKDRRGNYLPPFYDGCKHVIDSIYYKLANANTFTRYKDKNVSEAERLIALKKVEDELFGNETDMCDDLHSGSGVGFTTNKTLTH